MTENVASPRRRFQFRLRTLMIGVTLLAAACSYVGWQAKIVMERRLILNVFEFSDGGKGGYWVEGADVWEPYTPTHKTLIAAGTPENDPSWIRLWLGDRRINTFYLRSAFSSPEIHRIEHL
jgi:hypothetical protein